MNNDIINQGKIQVMQGMLEEKLIDVLDALEVKVTTGNRAFTGKCPIHSGDNPSALYIRHNLSAPEQVFHWKCYTHKCELHFKKTIIGLIRGILSGQNGWSKSGDKEISFKDTITWCSKFLKVDFNSLDTQLLNDTKQSFINKWINNKTKVEGDSRFLFQGQVFAKGLPFQRNTF